MGFSTRNSSASRLALGLALPLFAATPVLAQQATGATSATVGALPDVTVTAQRRSENIQTVPVAVTNFSEDQIESQNIEDLRDLNDRSPGLYLPHAGLTHSTNSYYIRGIGESDSLQNQSVSTYVDDVLIPRPTGATFDLFDIDNIELLRGPQGTLYGRNSSAGALTITTRDPGQQVRAFAEGGVGNYNDIEGRVGLSGPLADTLAGSISALKRDRDGTVHDQTLNDNVGKLDINSSRIKLRWNPDEKWDVTFAADGTQDDSDPTPIIPRQQAGGLDPNRNFSSRQINNRTNLGGTSLRAIYHLNDSSTFKSISSWRAFDQPGWYDQDGQTNFASQTFSHHEDVSGTEELQYQFEQNPYHITLGSFLLYDRFKSDRYNFSYSYHVPNNEVYQLGLEHTNSLAEYGQATYDLTDAWHLTGGGRFTTESHNFRYTGSTSTSGTLFNVQDPYKTWASFTPKAGTSYDWAANLSSYFSYSEGFKAGGFDDRASSEGAAIQPFAPEKVHTFEVGTKSDLFDRRLRANISLFHNDINNFQATATDPATNLSERFNLGNATTEGSELETTFSPVKGLTWQNNLTYLLTRTDSVAGIANQADVGHRLPYSPRWAFFSAANYIVPVAGPGTWQVGADATVTTTIYNEYVNVWADRGPDNILFDANASYTTDDGRWQYLVTIKNIANRQFSQGSTVSAISGYTTTYNDPRLVLFRVRYSY